MNQQEGKIGKINSENLFKLFLNDYDDFIYINTKDAAFFKRFAEFISWVDKKAEELNGQEKEFAKKYGEDVIVKDKDGEITKFNTDAFLTLSKLRSDTYKEMCEKLDVIFGQGTCKKYFRVFWEINPDFVPDDECIYDFLEEITPVLNRIYADRQKRITLKYNRNRKGSKSKCRNKEQLLTDYKKQVN